MYISNLHLYGFKSFLNKTNLEFGEGITAVVGPNGCGKSNIVDAIRWILGEQKPSVMRSAKKEDVIFNGTKNRKAISFCEASMMIHNNRGVLPIEYNDVEISRRLYRNGESEYSINKTPCRLKDIQNLFVDTGMSSNAYSVIELKMVDSILSHNTSDRRHMFEEAAGINNYKQQRAAAKRKLDATFADMERVNDIISEVNNNVKHLQLQMKRFERFGKLKENLKELHINTAKAEIQSLKVKIEPIQEKLNSLQQKQSSLSGQMNLDETLTQKVQLQFEEKKTALNTSQNNYYEIENSLSEINSKLLVWNEKMLGNENQILHFKDETKQNDEALNVLIKRKESLSESSFLLDPIISDRKKVFNQLEKNVLASRIKYEELLIIQENLKKNSESKYLKIKDEESSVERFKQFIHDKENQKSKLLNKKDQFIEKSNNCTAEINLVNAEIENLENIISQNTIKVEELQSRHSTAEEEIISMQSAISELKGKLTSLNSQKIFFENIIKTHADKPASIKNVLTEIEKYPYVKGVLSDLIEVENKYKLAVENVLGEYCNYLIVEARSEGMNLLTKLKSKAGIIILDGLKVTSNKKPGKNSLMQKVKHPSYLKPLIQILFQDIYLAEKEDKIDYAHQLNLIVDNGFYLSKGIFVKSFGSKEKSILGRQQELDKIIHEEEKINKKLKECSVQLEKIILGADDIHKSLKIATQTLDKNIDKLKNLELKLKNEDFNMARIFESTKEIDEEIRITEARLIDFNVKLNTSSQQTIELKKEYNEAEVDKEKFQSQLSDQRTKLNKEEKELHDSRIELMEIEKEKEGLEFRISTLNSQQQDLSDRIEKHRSDISRLEVENVSLSESIQSGKMKQTELNSSLGASLSEKEQLEKEYQSAYEELNHLQSGIRERQKHKENILNTIKEFELKIAETTTAIKHHQSRIYEMYKVNISNTDIDLEEIDISKQKAEIESIQRSIDRIGPINLAVSENYETESERLNFLQEQYGDLEKSESTLTETIEKLDSEARKKFISTFDAIKDNFSKTYTSFFNGGEGHLRLIGEQDPLDADIEIIARPPGKKTQTLRMLSAGEKALTAIALLFAIYLVKPSPFCILDEVDAPLDDTNIGKFTTVLKEFSANTQFIVVTHNKLTMEKSDYMYGVTQEEEGVSKIVSVKLQKEFKEMAMS
ncbi:MAG: chromosome segregation protein SMC [Candidatus Marinimicrobia bacterium]|nr:chromosome segregation protein SMC [Candidatus Neomarinimicrobiota bacterium]